jgi:protein-S-isoprenylcysteine O-methyltransferase Ste14
MGKGSTLKNWVTPLTVGHFLLMLNIGSNIFIKNYAIYIWLEQIGIAFIIPAIVLWIVPVMTLRQYGNISQYGSFLATTELVDKGIYRIIRHPQYLGFMLLSFGMALYFQLYFTIALSFFTIVMLIVGIKEEEKLLIGQFGGDYENYKQRVPSLNVVVGLIKLIKRKQ